MKKYLLLLFMLIALICPAYSDRLQSADGKYIMYTTINSGGTVLSSDTYKLYNSIGEPIGQKVEGGGYTFIPGILGLLGAGTGEVQTDIPGDNGIVRGTTIIRTTDNPADGKIKITWGYAPGSTVTTADIWRLAGQGTEYSKAVKWVKVATNIATKWDDNYTEPAPSNTSVKVGNGINAYYRVVPAGTVSVSEITDANSNIFLGTNNGLTAGKVDVGLRQSKIGDVLSLVAYPFDVNIPGYNKLSEIIGNQLNVGDVFETYLYSGGYSTSDVIRDNANNKNKWSDDIEFDSNAKGFWLLLRKQSETKTKFISMVGVLKNTDHTKDILTGLNLIGCPFAVSKDLSSAGFLPTFRGSEMQNHDIVFVYNNKNEDLSKNGYSTSDYQGQNRWSDPSIKMLLGEGFWYKSISAQKESWSLSHP